MKIIVIDGFAINPGDLSWEFLNTYGESIVYDKLPADEIVAKCADADILLSGRTIISREIIYSLPKLKFISTLGTGYDIIDLEACKERNITVCNIPSYSSDSVAQLTITLLLNLSTDLNGLINIVSSNLWTGIPGFEYQHVRFEELAGQTIGLIGYGSIGKRVAQIASALKMNVLVTTRSRFSGNEGIVSFVPLEVLISQSDYISLHCPLTAQTEGLVNSEFISHMRPAACLINTSRGAVLNEQDVAQALNSGRIRGAAFDVLSTDPPLASNPLLKAKNCIITPHSAWTSLSSRKRMLKILDDNINSFIAGNPINTVL